VLKRWRRGGLASRCAARQLERIRLAAGAADAVCGILLWSGMLLNVLQSLRRAARCFAPSPTIALDDDDDEASASTKKAPKASSSGVKKDDDPVPAVPAVKTEDTVPAVKPEPIDDEQMALSAEPMEEVKPESTPADENEENHATGPAAGATTSSPSEDNGEEAEGEDDEGEGEDGNRFYGNKKQETEVGLGQRALLLLSSGNTTGVPSS
jgi:outer membrane biosynthesis protein TonB